MTAIQVASSVAGGLQGEERGAWRSCQAETASITAAPVTREANSTFA
jgi:hypothetical protein